MPINVIAFAPLHGGRYIRCALECVAHRAKELCIKNGVNRGFIIMRALGKAFDAGAFGGGLGHRAEISDRA